MAKAILGVDIGSDGLKLALVDGGRVKKTASVPMPKNLVRDGRVVSTETVGELIRETVKKQGLRCVRAAMVLSGETVFVRTVVMPRMTPEQLAYNIPYEFNNYITDDLKNYVFDYAMISTPEELKRTEASAEDEGETEHGEEEIPAGSMELMAVACPVSLLEDAREMLRKAGLKLVKAAPAESGYISLIRRLDGDEKTEYCILDLGYQAIRMYMFRGDRHVVTRVLEVGLSTLDSVVADHYGVDIHLAHTYLLTDYDGCQRKEFCQNAYGGIAVELMRAVNFYRFSNPDSQLADVWLCGGGAVIEPLRNAVAEALDMTVHPAGELLPGGGFEDCNAFVQAVGVTLD